jgi:hypothetical protein
MMDVFKSLLAAPSSVKSLRDLISNPPLGSLLIVQGPGDLSIRAATELAINLTPLPYQGIDVRIARLENERWSLAELEQQVISPSQLTPAHRCVIVVEDADLMDRTAADRLLKVVEEPPNGCLFIFATTDVMRMPVTLRSRATRVLELDIASPAERVSALVEKGVEKSRAALCVERCGDMWDLTLLASRDDESFAASAVFDTSVVQDKAFTAAAEVALALEKVGLLGTSKKNEVAARAATRRACTRLLDVFAKQLQDALRTTDTNGLDLVSIQKLSYGLDEARDLLLRYAKVSLVLTRLWTA